jgi:hypothetical protein
MHFVLNIFVQDSSVIFSLKGYIFLSDLADEDVIETLRNSRKLSRKDTLAIRKRMETEKDMQNCFGFDVSTGCFFFSCF